MLCNVPMANNTQEPKWWDGPVPYDHLNALDAGELPLAADGQDAMDLAEYLLAGVLEAGPDNGLPTDLTADLYRVWELLSNLHPVLGMRDAYYHPTS